MTRRRGRSRRYLLAIVLVVAALAAACGGSSGGGSATEITNAPSSGGEANPDGIIRVGYGLIQGGGVMAWHDPTTGDNSTSANDALYYLVYGRLFRPTADGGIEPDLASAGTVVDANTIDLTIRDGVTFSDGTPFDPAAVKAGLERNLTQGKPDAFLQPFFSLKAIEVTGPSTLRLTIPDGTAASWFDAYLSSWQSSIVKPGETNFDEPIGAGPMVVESYNPEDTLALRTNPSYWDVDQIKVAGMDFVNVPFAQPEAGLNALRADQIDLTFAEASQVTSLSGNLKPFAVTNPNQVVWLHMCKKDGPLADARVRKAINKGIDRDAIDEAVYFGTAEPSTQMWPTGHRFNNPAVDDELAYDPEGAKQLLDEAGYADGVSIDIYPLPFAGISETTEVMKAQLEEIGITLNIQQSVDYVNNYLVPQPPAIGVYPGNSTGPAKLTAWTGTGIGNVCKWEDPELTAIYNELKTVSASSDQAVELWHEAAALVTDQSLGGFVVFRSFLAAYNDDTLGDLSSWPQGGYVVPNPWETFVKAGG